MNPHVSTLYMSAVLTLGSLVVPVSAQSSSTTYPSYVVDAQMPITSSDGFNNPRGLAVAPGGTVYVADSGNHRILQFSPAGIQTTVSFGTLSPAVENPTGVALDGSGNLYVADTATNRLVKLPAGGTSGLTIIRGPILNQPVSVAADAQGNLAIVNAGNSTITARRGGGTPFAFNTGATVLISPQAVAFDNQGMLYVVDSGNASTPAAVYRFPKLGGTGTSLTPAGYSLKNVTGLTLDAQRNLYVLDGVDDRLIETPINGAAPFLIPQSNFKTPSGLALDSLGNIYVADNDPASNTVTKFVYHHAANYGALPVGPLSSTITFNYFFYEPTTIMATRGIGGGVWNAEYHKAPGGTCALKTYYPMASAAGTTLPASCTVMFRFQPDFVGGRPGAVQLQTSNGAETQLVNGIGLGPQLALMPASITKKVTSFGHAVAVAVNAADTEIYIGDIGRGMVYILPVAGNVPTEVNTVLPTPSPVGLALNGAGDLFVLNAALPYQTNPSPPYVLKVPADGSAPSKLDLPALRNPQAIAVDPDGALYITDLGPNFDTTGDRPTGFVLRVTSTGAGQFFPSLRGDRRMLGPDRRTAQAGQGRCTSRYANTSPQSCRLSTTAPSSA